MLPKSPKKHSINTFVKFYEHMVFNLAIIFQFSILVILKATQVSKGADLINLSKRFLKDGAKFLSQPTDDLCNLSVKSFLTLVK